MSTTALAVVEQSEVAREIGGMTRQLLTLLGTTEQVRRFQRVTVQAFAKNPDLLECTPASVARSVLEAASMGLEPTGAVGGAHLVPYSVNVGTKDKPRWEKQAQLIPDYRGVVRLVTRPRADGSPSDVLSVEARVVKEGDEFTYELGTAPSVSHLPSLAPDRSSKPTTHVYAVARLRSGGTQIDVEDFAGIERVRKRGKQKAFSPWDSDWDEMGKKTMVKRLSKLLPVEPAVRLILAREDEMAGEPEPSDTPAAAATASQPRTQQLAARLRGTTPTPVAAGEAEPAAPAGQTARDAEPSGSGVPPAPIAPTSPAPAEEAQAVAACDSTSPYDGAAPCVKPAGHKGNHQSGEKESWS